MAASTTTTIPTPFNHTIPPPTILAQGAEGILYKSFFLSPAIPAAIKYRPVKHWRHPILDARLSRHRILAEARILVKCRREGVSVPGVLALDWEGATVNVPGEGSAEGAEAGEKSEATAGNEAGSKAKVSARSGGWMMMEWIDGLTVRQSLNAWLPKHEPTRLEPDEEEVKRNTASRPGKVKDLMHRIGQEIGKLHQSGVIHGDLTTSNLMLRYNNTATNNGTTPSLTTISGTETDNEATKSRPPLDGSIVLIDFGLATQSTQDEDRAVDLYVLERAFGSTHPNTEDLFAELLAAYRDSFKGARVVLKRLEDVRMRGRKKSMIG